MDKADAEIEAPVSFSAPSRGGKIAWLNTPHTHGLVSRILHWTTAVLIAVNIPLGLYVAGLPRGDQFREDLLSQMHKPLGLLLLFLVVGRLGWRLFFVRPDYAPGLKT